MFEDPAINHNFGGGVYAKESIIPANKWLLQHAHKHDHLSILASGSVELIVDGRKTIVHAPACLTIEAGKHHGVKTLTDVVWYCIHATDCTNANDVDNVIIADTDESQVHQIVQVLKEGG